MERWLPIASLLLAAACENQSAEVLRSVVSADLGVGVHDMGFEDLGASDDVDLRRALLIHHPYDLDQASNLGAQSVPACSRPPDAQVVLGGGVIGDALVSTSTVGCQNRNTRNWLPNQGPYAVSFFFRVDAPAPSGTSLRGFELRPLFELSVNDADELIIGFDRGRVRRRLADSISESGWRAFALRVAPDEPLAEVHLDGRLAASVGEDIGRVGPENGGIAAWVGAMDEVRTYGRWLTDAEILRLSEK